MSKEFEPAVLPPSSADSAALGLARLGADLGRAERTSPEALAIQAGIDATMRDVIRRDAHAPIHGGTSQFPETSSRPHKQETPGYLPEVPKVSLAGTSSDRAIGALCDAMLGPGVPKKVEK